MAEPGTREGGPAAARAEAKGRPAAPEIGPKEGGPAAAAELAETRAEAAAELGLKEGELAAIVETIGRNPRVISAAIFGSRAVGGHRPHSDVDIALHGCLGVLDVERVISDLDELPLVYKFDVVAYGLLDSPALREHIDSAGINIFDRGRVTPPPRPT